MQLYWMVSACVGFGLVGGCHSYRPQPIDLADHYAQWLERAASDVQAHAAALSRPPAALPEEPFDASDGLSMREAEIIALVYNGELRIARARAGLTAATAANAGLWSDPTLGADVLRVLDSVEHPLMFMGMLEFTLPLSGRLKHEKRLAGSEHAAALLNVAEQEWRVRMDVREAWVRWSSAAMQAELTAGQLADLNELVSIVDRIEAAGEFASVEARLFRIEQAARRNNLRLLQAERDAAVLEIKGLMGLAPEAAIDPQPLVHVEAPAIEDEPATLLARNPTLAQLRAGYESRERALALEIQRQYPDLMIGPAFGREEGRDRAGVGFSIPLPLWNRNRQAIAEAEAARTLARVEMEAMLESLMTQLAMARVQHAGAVDRRAIVEESIVPLAQAQFTDARRIAELGEVDTFLLLETLQRQLDAEVGLVEASAGQSLAALRIQRLIGPPQHELEEPGEPEQMEPTQ